jgi:cation-dependent mannose-6-phosphate receptor
MNVCRPLAQEIWNAKGPKPDEAAVVTRQEHGDFSFGARNDTLLLSGNDPLLVYQDGSPCPKDDKSYATTIVRFICDRGVFDRGKHELSDSTTKMTEKVGFRKARLYCYYTDQRR